MQSRYSPEQNDLLLRNLSLGLNAHAVLPFITNPLSEEDRHWLSMHSLADLVHVSVSVADENRLFRFAKDIAMSVLTHVATEAIVSQYKQATGDTPRMLEEPVSESACAEVNAIVQEELNSELANIDDRAENLAEELSSSLLEGSEGHKKDSSDFNALKGELKSQLKSGIKDVLQRDVEHSMSKDLKKKVAESQKQAKKAEKSIRPVPRKELRQIARQEKARYLANATEKIKLAKGLVGASVEFAANIIETSGDVEASTVGTAKSLAQDKATDLLVKAIGTGLHKVAPRAGSLVLSCGSKFFGVIGMLLDSDSIGPEQVIHMSGSSVLFRDAGLKMPSSEQPVLSR